MDETQNGTEDFDDETETNESTSDVLAVLAVLGAGAVIGAVATKGYSKAKDALKARVAAVKEKRTEKELAIETTAKEKKEK
jgi:hypothetical protein